MEDIDRFESSKKVGIFGMIGNVFLLIIKLIVAFLSGSQAMIADAVNSAGDIFASLMTFIGNKIASEPSDDNHTFGHGKAEYIFSLLISLSMIAAALKVLYNSVMSLIEKQEFSFSWFLVIVCIITILTKLILFLYTRKIYKKYGSILIKSNMKDHRNDCIVTTCTLISILFSLKGIFWIDGVVGIGIAIWICITGIKIFIESYNVLMDISIDESTKDDILKLISHYKEIQKIDKIYSSPVGYKYMISITIYVDGNMKTFDSHKIADSLEKDIIKLDKISNAIIHVNPI